jgi:hypothetical protein
MFEEGPCEQDDEQKHCPRSVDQRYRPQAEQLDYLPWGDFVFIEHVDCNKEADNGGEGHGPCPGAYGRRRIASECGRRPCRRRQVKWKYVYEDIGSLQTYVLVRMYFRALP